MAEYIGYDFSLLKFPLDVNEEEILNEISRLNEEIEKKEK